MFSKCFIGDLNAFENDFKGSKKRKDLMIC